MEVNQQAVSAWLQNLQDSICQALEQADGTGTFREENWSRDEGGGGRSRVMENGAVIEKAA